MSYLAYTSIKVQAVLLLILAAPIALELYTEVPSCGHGTVLEGRQCVLEGWQGEWKEILMNLNYDNSIITVEEGDHVRMRFNSSKDSDHFLPKTFTLSAFDISTKIPVEEEYTVDFFADKAGEFQYSSTGLCKVEIAGGNIVIVDCSIFCGEIGNARTGTILVEPAILNDLDESNRSK
jgi:hypothetical protein